MTENIINLAFFDFDGCLANTPMPNPGKQLWAEYHQKNYPYEGWWGRVESMDPDVFTIKTKPEVHTAWKKYYDLGYDTYVLTSRQPKFAPFIKSILIDNNVDMCDVMTMKGKITKGERIVEMVKQYQKLGYIVKHVVFYDDRMKEILTVEAVKDDLHVLGVKIDIVKIQSDATD